MATIILTSTQLGNIAYYKVMKRFIMFPQSGFHIRMDQQPFPGGDLSLPVGGNSPDYKYQFTSFHVKQDISHSSFKSTTEGPYLGTRIVATDTDYVYFNYSGGGVWQPVWGYFRAEQQSRGQTIWKQSGDLSSETWGFATEVARWFLGRMSSALGKGHEQGLATGPIQGTNITNFNQL